MKTNAFMCLNSFGIFRVPNSFDCCFSFRFHMHSLISFSSSSCFGFMPIQWLVVLIKQYFGFDAWLTHMTFTCSLLPNLSFE